MNNVIAICQKERMKKRSMRLLLHSHCSLAEDDAHSQRRGRWEPLALLVGGDESTADDRCRQQAPYPDLLPMLQLFPAGLLFLPIPLTVAFSLSALLFGTLLLLIAFFSYLWPSNQAHRICSTPAEGRRICDISARRSIKME